MAEWEELDEFRYHHRLREAGGWALVLFSAPACGACRRAERYLPEWRTPDIRLFKVDVQRSQALARAHDLFHLPALFVYRDGQFHARLETELSRPAFEQALAAALTGSAQEEP